MGGKTMREHFEAINHKQAIDFVEALVKEPQALSEWQVKPIHQLILKNIDDDNAGVYRKGNVVIAGAEHVPPDTLRLQAEMQTFIDWYQNESKNLYPAERVARVHADFVKIHPFSDGNGRTSRLLMNLELLKDGFPVAILPVSKRLEYYNALDTAHTEGNYDLFYILIADIVETGFNPYWHALGIKP